MKLERFRSPTNYAIDFELKTLDPNHHYLKGRGFTEGTIRHFGLGFCNTTYLVSVQAAVDWQDRGGATSSNMFMRIVGQSVGAALFGAMVNIGLRLGASMPHALGNIYILSCILGLVALGLALCWPARVGPTHSK